MKPGSPLERGILLETTKVSSENLSSALSALHGCWKSSSILWMHVNRFPTLPGLILGDWSSSNEQAVFRFSQQSKFSELLLRIEKPGQRWTRRRGGYLVALNRAPEEVAALESEGLLAIFLEPASPYSDFFSLTSVCDVDAGKIDVEVVGPGFDASDTLRSDITPHERFHLEMVGAKSRWDVGQVRSQRTYLVDGENYRASVQRRLSKIGARLKNPAFPDGLMDPAFPASTLRGLTEDATRYLKSSGQTILLEHANTYRPIPERLLNIFVSRLLHLCKTVAESEVPWRTFSLAASFLSDERLVIWDFFPAGEYDSRTLLTLKA